MIHVFRNVFFFIEFFFLLIGNTFLCQENLMSNRSRSHEVQSRPSSKRASLASNQSTNSGEAINQDIAPICASNEPVCPEVSATQDSPSLNIAKRGSSTISDTVLQDPHIVKKFKKDLEAKCSENEILRKENEAFRKAIKVQENELKAIRLDEKCYICRETVHCPMEICLSKHLLCAPCIASSLKSAFQATVEYDRSGNISVQADWKVNCLTNYQCGNKCPTGSGLQYPGNIIWKLFSQESDRVCPFCALTFDMRKIGFHILQCKSQLMNCPQCSHEVKICDFENHVTQSCTLMMCPNCSTVGTHAFISAHYVREQLLDRMEKQLLPMFRYALESSIAPPDAYQKAIDCFLSLASVFGVAETSEDFISIQEYQGDKNECMMTQNELLTSAVNYIESGVFSRPIYSPLPSTRMAFRDSSDDSDDNSNFDFADYES